MLAANSMNISQNMEEIERTMIMRDGRWAATAPFAVLSGPSLIQRTVGREKSEQLPRRTAHPGADPLRLGNGSALPILKTDG